MVHAVLKGKFLFYPEVVWKKSPLVNFLYICVYNKDFQVNHQLTNILAKQIQSNVCTF